MLENEEKANKMRDLIKGETDNPFLIVCIKSNRYFLEVIMVEGNCSKNKKEESTLLQSITTTVSKHTNDILKKIDGHLQIIEKRYG